MNKLFFCCAILIIGFSRQSVSRQVASDTSKQQLPQLELPEITIVGKKAVTLPFARKGEMYDVNIYRAPQPDSSLIGQRSDNWILPGSVANYTERLHPWHFSADGFVGSFMSGAINAYASYNNVQWQLGGHAGYYSTRGHTTNASASLGMVDARAHTLLKTDNDILQTLTVSLDAKLSQNTYGMFGIPGINVDRTRNNFELATHVGSLDRHRTVVDFSVATRVWSLTDRQPSINSQISSISPEINGVFETKIKGVKLLTGLTYVSSSLDYNKPTQSPSIVNISASGEWRYSHNWLFRIGGMFANGSDNSGRSQTLVSPTIRIGLNFDSRNELAFWWKPEMNLATYDENIRRNPYLIREFTIIPERKTVNIGSTFRLIEEKVQIELTASISQSKNKNLTMADSGKIWLDYVEASQVMLRFDGTLKPSQKTMFRISGDLQPSNEMGSDVQLPMIPLFRLQSRGEIELDAPIEVWASLDYWSKQNIDRQGMHQLDSPVLLGTGISTTFLKQATFLFEISNILNSGYEWWSGYAAPGLQFTFLAKVNLQ